MAFEVDDIDAAVAALRRCGRAGSCSSRTTSPG
jgi:hypothetical protein